MKYIYNDSNSSSTGSVSAEFIKKKGLIQHDILYFHVTLACIYVSVPEYERTVIIHN